jgi:hypothetical protein
MIHSDSPFCEIVSLKNYFTTEIVTMDSLLVQLHFTIRQWKFLNSFREKIYHPELLFGSGEILERIKNHPMALWKCSQK